MSERTIKIFDKRGQLVSEHRMTTEAEGLAERVSGLRAAVREMMDDPVIQETLTWVCDGCGARIQLDLRQLLALPDLPCGWITTPEGELCPACQRERG